MDQSFGARPFRFDVEFAPDAHAPDSPFSDAGLSAAALQAEIAALRAGHDRQLADAREAGFLEGQALARAERDAAILSALDALLAEWEAFADARAAMLDDLTQEARELALAVGEALAARAIDGAPAQAVDDAIGRALEQVARGQEIIVTVNPDLVGDVEARMAARQSRDRRRLNVVVEAAADVFPGDARLRWDGGGLSLDRRARAAALLAEFEGCRSGADGRQVAETG